MVLKFQGYKKCVNSTRDKMCFRNAGERITALNSFRRAESYERGTDRDLIFLEIGTKSNRNPGIPKRLSDDLPPSTSAQAFQVLSSKALHQQVLGAVVE